ncbi:T9SS type A sorting domain-containing protein [Lewinella sp. W8]|uniref:T9SS type A sorting domain-containing protein n=1 Tax=Lewinella sp. W8 TaxID=2528208 RepID=UPI001567A954|nr:T9SS type A sorting domain-containing protein [Lewinella sp. W8]
MLATILLFVFAAAQGQHRGQITIDDFPAGGTVLVVSESGDTLDLQYLSINNQLIADWNSSTPCVRIDLFPRAIRNYVLQYGEYFIQDIGTGPFLTCPPEGEFNVTPPPPCDDHVYPNPTFGPLYSDCGGRWTVYSMSGRLVMQRSKSIDLSGLPAGNYLLRRKNYKTIIIKQ